jgi:hypothetical protein
MNKRNQDKPNDSVIGMAWYKQDQWPVLLQVSSDSNKLESTYEEWLEYAEDTYRRFVKEGLTTEKVAVDVFELIKWCKDHNYPVNGNSRASYTAEILYNTHKNDDKQAG